MGSGYFGGDERTQKAVTYFETAFYGGDSDLMDYVFKMYPDFDPAEKNLGSMDGSTWSRMDMLADTLGRNKSQVELMERKDAQGKLADWEWLMLNQMKRSIPVQEQMLTEVMAKLETMGRTPELAPTVRETLEVMAPEVIAIFDGFGAPSPESKPAQQPSLPQLREPTAKERRMPPALCPLDSFDSVFSDIRHQLTEMMQKPRTGEVLHYWMKDGNVTTCKISIQYTTGPGHPGAIGNLAAFISTAQEKYVPVSLEEVRKAITPPEATTAK